MAALMRSSSQETGHRARVADSKSATAKPDTASTPTTATTTTTTTTAPPQSSNFEYDDNEWDIGIGDLIIDLDADIEKTNESTNNQTMATNAGGGQASKTTATAKMHIEHSATADKGLKMKIKRTKPGTKTSEAKHEIVKSNEQNGSVDQIDTKTTSGTGKHGTQSNNVPSPASINSNSSSNNSKRGSSGHRRDKTRDKHNSSSLSSSSTSSCSSTSSNSSTSSSLSSSASSTVSTDNKPSNGKVANQTPVTSAVNVTTVPDVNGIVKVSAPQNGPPRSVFPVSTGPGPPQNSSTGPGGPPSSPAAATAQGSASKPEQTKITTSTTNNTANLLQSTIAVDETSSSPPPMKKLKTESRDVADACVGTSVGTITEPDCLGPCEPGTSVTLEGIVWHETEGGVLVVNVTWRGKTYVGTLLDCTRHDWAPPRFCDSPTSDLDNRTPKGRGKRGRTAATATPSTDLSNFTETRSSVHSKLRNGSVKGRRGAAANGSGTSTAPSSPTPFIPPRPEPNNKRKTRIGEEEVTHAANVTGKKTKVVSNPTTALPVPRPPTPNGSPPSSPVLLECPEPNCSKKYKHINGLKYHQSHAHGLVDDEDTKDITSMSENDESNIEVPSPATPIKSPDKSQDSPLTPPKKDCELPIMLRGANLLEVSSQPATPRSTPPSPATPPSIQDLGSSAPSPTVPIVDGKNVVKPGVLRYTPEEFTVNVFPGNKPQTPGSSIGNTNSLPSTGRSTTTSTVVTPTEQTNPQMETSNQPQSFSNQLQSQVNMPTQHFTQPTNLLIPAQNISMNAQPPTQLSPHPPLSPSHSSKITPFKVKSTASLMPDDKKHQQNGNNNKVQNFKKKNRKSPAGSPHPPHAEQQGFGMEQSGRDEVQSPAYSDISDDGAPVMEAEISDKNKNTDKKSESGQPLPHLPQYSMYPFYNQPHQYLMPSLQQQQQTQEPKAKETERPGEKAMDKDGKKDGSSSEFSQKVLPQHYYPYGYVPGYPYNMDPNFGGVPLVQEDKIKEERVIDASSPTEPNVKQSTPIPNPIQVPTPGKSKSELKEKHQNENHQILKESIEIKNQMNPYLYSRQQTAPPQTYHSQRDEDVRRFYVYSDQRRKEQQQQQQQPQSDHKLSSNQSSNKNSMPPSPSMKHKDSKSDEKKEKEVKQEGVKPTMETQGPPPPPTSQYAYIHPSYMQSPHYGALPFDPNHPMYRGIMVPGPYSGSPYIHAQIPRYHAPEDLSRAPPPKALDMLQHHAQYYSSHKIHELQERAIKSPTPKTSIASSSPSNNLPPSQSPATQMSAPPTSQSSVTTPSSGKQMSGDGKESRSPPPQRHVHTHHHTHVGLGYPMYAPPYGAAAVLASQQAAAVTVINPFPTK